jgi:hypothetical protein
MTTKTGALLLVSSFVSVAAMVYAGRPASDDRYIREGMALWAAVAYVVAYLMLNDLPRVRTIGVAHPPNRVLPSVRPADPTTMIMGREHSNAQSIAIRTTT